MKKEKTNIEGLFIIKYDVLKIQEVIFLNLGIKINY